ncbi:MAG: hypothetical protein ACOY3P_24245 [Planctomycetota bacterium]
MDYAPIVSSLTPIAVPPPGKALGCLPRESKIGQWCPMASERIKIIPRAQWADFAQDISLRPHVREVLDQDGVGSCAAEATTGGVMIGRAFAGLPHVSLNPWSIYRVTSGGRDRGSAIDANLEYAREHGICPMDMHPRSLTWRAEPSEAAKEAAKQYRIVEFYDVTTIDEMVSCLLMGFPVVYGSSGHAVCKVAHLDDSRGLDLNSWGADWGDGGFGVWASYRAVDFRYGAFAIRTVE